MPEEFDENALMWALTTRPEDARKFATSFSPSWLNNVPLRPILAEVYAFTRKNGEPPSIPTLHEIFKDKDEQAYNLRFKETLDSIVSSEPDNSMIIYTLDKARDVAIVRSLVELCTSQKFIKDQTEYEGKEILKSIISWMHIFQEAFTDRTMDIKEAIDFVVKSTGFEGIQDRIPIGITCIDKWTGGGLRPKQLGIVLGATGKGKSVVLTIIAHKVATIERKRVWIITNELSLEELTERFMSRMTGTNLNRIIKDPAVAYRGLGRHWRDRLNERLRITEMNREASIDEIESEMMKWINLHGWKPNVVVIDFMERMKPALSGYHRDKEWQWLGGIAKDLIRFAKRHNILVWTAGQFNREALKSDKEEMSMAMTQSSIRHLQEATAVIGMDQLEMFNKDDETQIMKLKPLKMRQSAMTARAVYLKCNLNKMNITNIEVDPQESSNAGQDNTRNNIPSSQTRTKSLGGSTPRQRQQRGR